MSNSRSPRRSFLTKLGAGMTVAAAAFEAGSASAAQTAAGAFQPARHPEDAWMDALAGSHRLVIDTTTPRGFGEALAFAGNFLTASANGYKLADKDSAVIIVARHFATPFAYKDAMWAKYGTVIPAVAVMNDPKTGQPPPFNLFNATGYDQLPNFGTTVDAVLKRGVHLAVCQMAAGFFAREIAKVTSAPASDVAAVLAANLFENSHIVPAGIVAVNRAQEYGYTLASAG
jgi:hypothetical protein